MTATAANPTVETVTIPELSELLCRVFEAVERTSHETDTFLTVPFMRKLISAATAETSAVDFYFAIYPELAKITDMVFDDREIVMTKWARDVDTAIYTNPMLTQDLLDVLFDV